MNKTGKKGATIKAAAISGFATILAAVFTVFIGFWGGLPQQEKLPARIIIDPKYFSEPIEVYINGQSYGKANDKGKIIIADLKPGNHMIEIKRENYHPIKKEVRLYSGESIPLTAQLLGGPNKLESQIRALQDKIAQFENNIKMQTGADFSKLFTDLEETRLGLKKIEDLILDKPEYAVSLPLLKKDIESLKQQDSNLADRINKIHENTKWLYAIMATMVLGLLGLVVSVILALKSNKSEPANHAQPPSPPDR